MRRLAQLGCERAWRAAATYRTRRTLTGDQPAGLVLFQLPAFADNIAHASAGTVTVGATVRTVTVQLTQLEPAS